MNSHSYPDGGNLFEHIRAFAGQRVLVIGDAMLDCYLEGESHRISREAPVPVVAVSNQRSVPGGAANTAANMASLGGNVALLALTGMDPDAAALRTALEARGVSAEYLVADPDRRTLAKRRVLAGGHMLVRFDEGSTAPAGPAAEERLLYRLAELFPVSDAVIVSDYAYGVLTPRVIAMLADLQARLPRVVVADAKNLPAYAHVGLTAVKPNYGEAVGLLGVERVAGTCARADQVAPLGERILELTGAQIAAVTLDGEGAVTFERGAAPYRTYADPAPDLHATGAGDTFVAALTLALAAGAETPAAAELASGAASVVVHRQGTTTCSAQDLWDHFTAGAKFVSSPSLLQGRLAEYRQNCRRVVFTNGCFDILHRGHIAYLNQAKALGDVLIVAVNSDASVSRLKGPTRPLNPLEDRVQVLAALSCVDHIIAFEEDTPIDVIRAVRPDIYVKGGDYTIETLPEAPVVQELGGEVHILPYVEERSTTGLIQRIREVYGVGASV